MSAYVKKLTIKKSLGGIANVESSKIEGLSFAVSLWNWSLVTYTTTTVSD